jgi:hypothetical protein
MDRAVESAVQRNLEELAAQLGRIVGRTDDSDGAGREEAIKHW